MGMVCIGFVATGSGTIEGSLVKSRYVLVLSPIYVALKMLPGTFCSWNRLLNDSPI